MHTYIRTICFALILVTAAMGWGQETHLYDFSKSTNNENGIMVMGPGFGNAPLATLGYGDIPVDNAFSGATDGKGIIITAAPGEGAMILTKPISCSNCALIRCSIRTSTPHASIHLASIDQGENAYVSTITPNNVASFVGQYNRIADVFLPPSTGFQALVQVLNTSTSENLTIYIDNLEIVEMDSTGINLGIEEIVAPDNSIQPSPTNVLQPTVPSIPTIQPTSTPISEPTIFPTATQVPVRNPITIQGRVTGQRYLAVIGAKVQIGDLSTTTSGGGSYFLNLPEPGEYFLRIEAPGYPVYETTVQFTESTVYNVDLTRPPSQPVKTPTPISSTPLPGTTPSNTPTHTPTQTPTVTPSPTATFTPTQSAANYSGKWYVTAEIIDGSETEVIGNTYSMEVIISMTGSSISINVPSQGLQFQGSITGNQFSVNQKVYDPYWKDYDYYTLEGKFIGNGQIQLTMNVHDSSSWYEVYYMEGSKT